jgi:hypothetical protein
VTLPLEPQGVPEPFRAALVGLRAALTAPVRAGLELQEVPGPKRLAPYAVAVAAEICRDDEQVASGRFVVLHDPQGQEGWRGDTRVVAFVSADVEAGDGRRPALAQSAGAGSPSRSTSAGRTTRRGGTVTRTVSCRFGQIEDADEASEVEVGPPWTPLPGADGALDLGSHLRAWCDLLCSTAGLRPPAWWPCHR